MVFRLVLGIGLGSVIGLERQYRARMAGLRTNALVAAGSTLFVLLSSNGFHGGSADPTRVAAQIVSGIGFLGAGVIMRDGLNIRGLNTAATLWCSAAIGSLAGAGLWKPAVAGSVVVLVSNIGLRGLGRLVDRNPGSGTETRTDYTFRVVARGKAETHIRALMVQALTGSSFQLLGVASRKSSTPDCVEISASLMTETRDDSQLEAVVARLSMEPEVNSVSWDVQPTQEPGDFTENGAARRRLALRAKGR
ncbi:MgtC/SapB family protein [Pseudonocardiaceae bacterium YIM PH 21723]|nr:MgtC/SapB family protein [Pseudonocardiaceae bacterium YIM PH 21723]